MNSDEFLRIYKRVDMLDDEVLSAVLDYYDTAGVAIWCRSWLDADEPARRRMRIGLISA